MYEFLKDLESEQTAATADLNAHDASAMISPGNGGRVRLITTFNIFKGVKNEGLRQD